MKTILKVTAVVALMFVSMTGMANEPRLSLVVKENSKSLVFESDSRYKESTVELVDVSDNAIFYDRIADVEYTKTFDLDNLGKETYYLRVTNSSRVTIFTIRLTGNDVEIFKTEENSKPIFKKTADKVYLNLLNPGRKKVAIKVIDSEKRVIFKETIKNKMLVEKVFSFEKAHRDCYTVVVNDGDDTYYENFVVD